MMVLRIRTTTTTQHGIFIGAFLYCTRICRQHGARMPSGGDLEDDGYRDLPLDDVSCEAATQVEQHQQNHSTADDGGKPLILVLLAVEKGEDDACSRCLLHQLYSGIRIFASERRI